VPEVVNERIKQDPKGRYETVTGLPTLLVDGVVTGLWRREKHGQETIVDVEPVVPLRRGRTQQLAAAAERVREILR
jgi:hypothetical protein